VIFPVKAAARAVAVAAALLSTSTAVWSQPKPAPIQPPAASGRTEILNYDNWTVTCRDPTDAKEKRVCSAELSIFQESGGQRRAVFSWVIGYNKEGVLSSQLRFPPGVSIAPGIELKFADKPPRKIAITSCEPGYCEATTPLDDGFIRDASPIVQAEAVITASNGQPVTFTINMKGFTQAVAAVRR